MPHLGRVDMPRAATTVPLAITMGPAPFTYTAPADGLVILTGGTVSLVQYGRGTTLTALGIQSGLVPIFKGDIIKISWAVVAPTLTFIPATNQ